MDPFPNLAKVMRVRAPKDVLVMDLDDPTVWNRSKISPHDFTAVHWGGGPNPAGEPLEDREEPTSTWRDRLAIQFGRVKRVVRIWESWHINGRGMSAIAYCAGIDPIFGRCYRWRGFKHNGGQWGEINSFTLAIVFILGLTQYPRKAAWKTLGLIWFFSGGDRDAQMVGHRFFNGWPQSKTSTSCPGDRIANAVHRGAHIDALGVLKTRIGFNSRGRRVRACTLKLTELGYLPRQQSLYTTEVGQAVRRFRIDVGIPPRNIVDRPCWEKLAAA